MVRLENVNKYFNKGKNNEIHVINDISFEFKDSGLIAILRGVWKSERQQF